jgi:glycosyltransferase involved in cell wall biosynthesis
MVDKAGGPKVSVMIPVYNAKEFIADCLDSILSQDYQNLELVVSDDFSTDGTQNILKKYAGDERIKLLLNDRNLGITDNCNQALSYCTGEYVSFFAGDDVMLPNKITSQVTMLEKHQEASMCYHRVNVFDSDSGKTLYDTESHGQTIYSFLDIIEKGGLPGINSVIARRECLPPNLYNNNFSVVSDWLFMLEIALRGKIIFIDQIYTRYRKHLEGASMKANNLLDETLLTLNYMDDRFNGNLKVSSSCNKSRRRVLLGALFRALNTRDKKLVTDLIGRFFDNRNYIISMVTYIYLHTVLNFKVLNDFLCERISKTYRRK